VAQGVGPEFKSQYHKKAKQNKTTTTKKPTQHQDKCLANLIALTGPSYEESLGRPPLGYLKLLASDFLPPLILNQNLLDNDQWTQD
jgi:hypothetical protein